MYVLLISCFQQLSLSVLLKTLSILGFCYSLHTRHRGVLSTAEQLVCDFLRFSLDCILPSPGSLFFNSSEKEIDMVADIDSFFRVFSKAET